MIHLYLDTVNSVEECFKLKGSEENDPNIMLAVKENQRLRLKKDVSGQSRAV